MVNFIGTAGNDYFVSTAENDFFDGGTGYDVVDERSLGRRATLVTAPPNGGDVTLTTPANQVDAFRGIEQIDFVDGRLVFGLNLPAVQVVRLYNAALARSPDQGGLNTYIFELENGVPLSTLAGNFLASPEFQTRFGADLTNDQYIARLYGNVLGRNPDAAETRYYQDVLNNGVSRQQVLVNFSESPENQARTLDLVRAGVWDYNENAATVARLYDAAFNRLPDLEGLRFYREQIDLGLGTPSSIVDGFVASPEFQTRYGNVNSSQFTQLLYRNALDREANQAEVNYYATRLDSGELSRGQMVLNFSESPEHRDLTAPNIMSEQPAQFGILFA